MPRVFLAANVKATWRGEYLNESPAAADELARIAVRLLVEEHGTHRARLKIRRELAKYRPDYKGAGSDADPPLA